MDEAYKMACTEVTEALKYIPLEEYHKIPGKVLKFIKDNCDSKYNYKYDVKNPKLSKRANIIITKLYLDYIADEKEKRNCLRPRFFMRRPVKYLCKQRGAKKETGTPVFRSPPRILIARQSNQSVPAYLKRR